MKIISNFPKVIKKKRMDKSFDLIFTFSVVITLALVLVFIITIEEPEPIPEVSSKPIIKEVESVEPTLVSIAAEPTEEYLIASIVMAEAEGEEMIGKVAVASVILNRCEIWNKSVSEVINEPNQFATGKEPNEECLRSVEIAMENRDLFPKDLLYFRNAHYHEFGCPFLVIGHHYFSTEGGK